MNAPQAPQHTPPHEAGEWRLIGPSGKTWLADSPLKCVGLEQRERIPASVALKRIFSICDEPDEVLDALVGLEVLYLRDGEGWNECFERVGELFHRDTGYLRPGKDYGALSNFDDEQGRSAAWEKWIADKVSAARAAIARATGA